MVAEGNSFKVQAYCIIIRDSQTLLTRQEKEQLALDLYNQGKTVRDQLGNHTHLLKSFERSLSDLIPFLPFKMEEPTFYDYILKTFGVLSFGIIFISLRRRFERRFRH
jgi:hypothetical protein